MVLDRSKGASLRPKKARVRRRTLTAQSEGALRQDIIEGVFMPGQRLTSMELAERYDVSATPLREALQRLAAENLVEIDPRLGATVAPISRSHLQDTYRVLELLQAAAVAESIAAGDGEWEHNLRTLFGEFQVAVALSQNSNGEGPPGWSRAHRAFHDGLIAASKSVWLKSMLNTLTAHSERYRILSARTGVRDPISEHATIFAAAVARDIDGAVEAIRQHLRRTVDVIERSILAVQEDEAKWGSLAPYPLTPLGTTIANGKRTAPPAGPETAVKSDGNRRA